MAFNPIQLKEQLRSVDPAMSDADAAALLSVPVIDYKQIPLDSLEAFLLKTGVLSSLKAVAADEKSPVELRAGLGDLFALLGSTRLKNLDFPDPEIRVKTLAIVDGLVATGQFTAEQKEIVLAMGQTVQYLAGDAVTEADVKAAREFLAAETQALQLNQHIDQRVRDARDLVGQQLVAGKFDLEAVKSVLGS